MISNVDEDEKVLHTENMKGNYIMDVWYLTEDEKLKLQIVVAGQRREVVMLTEDEKVLNNIYTLGGMQRNKYVWRI